MLPLCMIDAWAQAVLQVLTSDAAGCRGFTAGCRGFTVAPAGSALLAAAPFSFVLPPVPLQKPVTALPGYAEHPHHSAKEYEDSLYASHTALKQNSVKTR